MSERSHFFDLSRKPEPTLPRSKNYKAPKIKYYWKDSKQKPIKPLTCWDNTLIAQATERPDISVKTPLLSAESSSTPSEVLAEARKTAGQPWKILGDNVYEGWEKTGKDVREAWKDSGKATYMSIMQTGEHAKDVRKKVAIPEPYGRNAHAAGNYRPAPNELKSKRGKGKNQKSEPKSEAEPPSDNEDQAKDLESGEQKTCWKHSRRTKMIMITLVLLAFGLLGGSVIVQKLQKKKPENNGNRWSGRAIS